MKTIGIVGNGSDKFTPTQIPIVKNLIKTLLPHDAIMVSGHSPVGGVDIWAEEVAQEIGIPMDLKIPKQHAWDGAYGYKKRNLDIAKSNEVHVIVAQTYPNDYAGRRFTKCYHCHNNRPPHVKSGACWTALRAIELGNKATWHIIGSEES